MFCFSSIIIIFFIVEISIIILFMMIRVSERDYMGNYLKYIQLLYINDALD